MLEKEMLLIMMMTQPRFGIFNIKITRASAGLLHWIPGNAYYIQTRLLVPRLLSRLALLTIKDEVRRFANKGNLPSCFVEWKQKTLLLKENKGHFTSRCFLLLSCWKKKSWRSLRDAATCGRLPSRSPLRCFAVALLRSRRPAACSSRRARWAHLNAQVVRVARGEDAQAARIVLTRTLSARLTSLRRMRKLLLPTGKSPCRKRRSMRRARNSKRRSLRRARNSRHWKRLL